MRRSCPASTLLAISTNLRAALSGSEYGRLVTNFICHPYYANGRSAARKKSANAPQREISFAPTNGHPKRNAACQKRTHALRYDRRDACLIAVNRVGGGCWKLDAKTRSIGSARRDRKQAAVRFDD